MYVQKTTLQAYLRHNINEYRSNWLSVVSVILGSDQLKLKGENSRHIKPFNFRKKAFLQ